MRGQVENKTYFKLNEMNRQTRRSGESNENILPVKCQDRDSPDYSSNTASKNSSIDFEKSINVNAAIVWERLSIGYRIADLKKDKFDEALGLIKEFFTLEPMCRSTVLRKDKISMHTYIEMIITWLSEMKSMCAIHEGSGKLVGIAVMTVRSKGDQSKMESRIRVSQGEAIFKILTLKSCVFGLAHHYEKYEIDEYLRLHILCVDNASRNRGIGTALVRSCIECSRRVELPACIGAFSSGAAQTIAERLGFENLAEISYEEYVTPGKTEKPFSDAGPGNYSVACMGLRTMLTSVSPKPITESDSTTSISKEKKSKKKKT